MFKLIKDYLLILVGLLFLSASPVLFYGKQNPFMWQMNRDNELGFYFSDFIQQIVEIVQNLLQKETWLNNHNIIFTSRQEGFSLIEILPQRLLYSLEIFTYSLGIAICSAFVFGLFIQLSPRIIKRVSSYILFILGSMPDILYIIALQVFVIYIFKSTGVLLVEIAVYNDKIYLAPILCLTIIPTVYLIRMLILHLEEEDEKPYSEFAKAKGLTRLYIMVIHNLRNALNSLMGRTKVVAAFMLSNLFMIEVLFNINGIMSFLIRATGVELFILLSVIATTIYIFALIIELFKIIYSKFIQREGIVDDSIV